MRFYTGQHEHYCGIDLHSRTMYLCIVTATGEVVLQRNVKSRPAELLRALKRSRGLRYPRECSTLTARSKRIDL